MTTTAEAPPQAAGTEKKKVEHSKLYHGALVVGAFSLLVTFWLCQGKPLHHGGGGIRGLWAPIFEYLEGTHFAHLLTFVVLFSIPEPSPVVFLFAWLAVYCPPTELWKSLVQNYGFVGLFNVGLPIAIIAVYLVNGFFCLALELYIAPEAMDKMRIQKGTKFEMGKMSKLVRNLSMSLACVAPIIFFMGKIMPLRMEETLPGPLETSFHIASYGFASEIWFYHMHTLMHTNKWLYKNVHKVHHEFKNPNALSSIYSHPIENLCSNFAQFCIGAILFGGHLYTFFLWAISSVLVTQTHHCGFRWPWIPSWGHMPNWHDDHHKHFNVNYGTFEGRFSLDTLHGTAYLHSEADKKKD